MLSPGGINSIPIPWPIYAESFMTAETVLPTVAMLRNIATSSQTQATKNKYLSSHGMTNYRIGAHRI